MSWLAKYFRTGVRQFAIAGVALPPESIGNFVSGVSGVDNAASGRTDLTVTAAGMTQQSVSGGGSVNAAVNQWVYADNTGGNSTVNFPAPLAGTQVGVADAMHGSPPASTWTTGHETHIPNPSSNIEDPNNPGTFTTTTIVLSQPAQSVLWQGNPGNTLWKVVG